MPSVSSSENDPEEHVAAGGLVLERGLPTLHRLATTDERSLQAAGRRRARVVDAEDDQERAVALPNRSSSVERTSSESVPGVVNWFESSFNPALRVPPVTRITNQTPTIGQVSDRTSSSASSVGDQPGASPSPDLQRKA